MGLDSVEIVMEIEAHFGIVIPDAEAERARSIADLVEIVCVRRGAEPDGSELESTSGEIESSTTEPITRASIANDVRLIVSRILRVPFERVRLESRLVEDLGAD